MNRGRGEPTDLEYQQLLSFRDGLRRFLRWSEQQAATVGLTGTQHQLLLAIRGHGSSPSVGDVAEHLLLRHHSAVELVDRAERAGLVRREHDPDDHRVVRVTLAPRGQRHLRTLSQAHLEELSRIGPAFAALWTQLPPVTEADSE